MTVARRRKGRLPGTGIWVAIVWSVLVGLAIVAVSGVARRNARMLALHEARALFLAVTDFRNWAAQRGGVYVAITDRFKPNPYLPANRRLVHTTDGRTLALVHPAMMTREAAAMGQARGGTVMRITSLKPLRPANAARGWERTALRVISERGGEYAQFATDDAQFRYMGVLRVTRPCLQCHEAQGYRRGDVRGGISITMPASPFVAIAASQRHSAAAVLGIVWLLGMVVIVGIARGFRQKRLMLARLEQMSLLDTLTAVSNRRGFMARAEQAMRSMIRDNQLGVLWFVDVDAFKQINDRYGHEEGDAALRRVAALLVATFRESDIVARVGGDEFVVLMLDASDPQAAAARCRIEQAVAAENAHSASGYTLSLSIGTVSFRATASTTLDQILVDADRAMYAEKRRKTWPPSFMDTARVTI